MTNTLMAKLNRKAAIVRLKKEAPYLTGVDIARLVGGCGGRYVSYTLLGGRKKKK